MAECFPDSPNSWSDRGATKRRDLDNPREEISLSWPQKEVCCILGVQKKNAFTLQS